MQDRPNRCELLATLEEFLRDDLLPELEGGPAYQLRVALNLVGILKRDEALSSEHNIRERILIGNLIGERDEESLAVMNARFCAAIAAGDLDRSSSQLIAALKAITADKLEVVRPGYDEQQSS